MNYRIFPPEELPECSISLPFSKSMSARALVINALQHASGTIPHIAGCTDTLAISTGLAATTGTVNVDNAGTAMRFLTAYHCATPGSDITLDGCERMRHRPIGALVDALRQCGADIRYTDTEGFPPLKIRGTRLRGGEVTFSSSASSQFISALMMVAPYMEQGLKITLEGDTPSLPYIAMTAKMMESAGAEMETSPGLIEVRPLPYSHPITAIEHDWSAAAFWYEIEALTSGFITLPGLEGTSVQGDKAVAKIFADLGVDTEFTDNGTELVASPELSPRLQLDLADTPDLVPPILVTCVMLRIPFRFTGLETLRLKECDRVEALCTEMLRLGAVLTVEAPGILSWDAVPRPILALPRFDSHADHRIAMALAPVAAYIPGIVICDAEVVGKSYPSFWNDLALAGFTVQDENDPIPTQYTDEQ